MQDEKQAAIEHYRLLVDHLREGGCSPNQVRALEERAKLRARCDGSDEFRKKLEELNMLHEPARGAKLDELLLMERAARESGDDERAALYARAAMELEPVHEYNALHTLTSQWTERLRSFTEEREEQLHRLTVVMVSYAELACLHGADRDRAVTLAMLRENCEKIEEAGAVVEQLIFHRWYRAHLPFNDAQCAAAAREIRKMRSWPDIDAQAMQDIRAKMTESLREIQGRETELARLAADEDARSRRKEFLAVAPDDAPGPYAFEQIWEGPA